MQSAYAIPGYADLIEHAASKMTGRDLALFVLSHVQAREHEGKSAGEIIFEEMTKAFDAQLDEIRRLTRKAASRGSFEDIADVMENLQVDTDIEVASRWQHRKGGTYQVIAVGRLDADLSPVVIYQADKDATVWVRPLAEFEDGRFTLVEPGTHDRF